MTVSCRGKARRSALSCADVGNRSQRVAKCGHPGPPDVCSRRSPRHRLVIAAEPSDRTFAAVDVSQFEPWVDKRTVARHIGCSVRTVENYMKLGMPYVKRFANGPVRFRLSEVDAWMRGRGSGQGSDSSQADEQDEPSKGDE